MPLTIIGVILVIAGLLLQAGRVLEQNRIEQRLISDTLWSAQSVGFEAARIVEGLRGVGGALQTPEEKARHQAGVETLLRRNHAIVAVHVWSTSQQRLLSSYPGAEDPDLGAIAQVASRAALLRAPATRDRPGSGPQARQLLVAVPLQAAEDQVAVACVSLEQLLQDTIPWWLAQTASIRMEDSSGGLVAQRDGRVLGQGIYTHRIALGFVDRTFYLHTDSTSGTPQLLPDVLAVSVALLAALLAWSVYALWRDLERRTRAEAALRQQQALQEAMERSLVTGLRAVDLRGRVTHANPAYCAMAGRSLEELQCMTAQPHAAANGGVDAVFEERLVRPDGSEVDLLLHEAPLLDGNGEQIGWMASVQDVTEQKRVAEVVRLQAERLAKLSRVMTMGEMASALAHELNQPLAAATSYLTAGLNLLARQRAPSDLLADGIGYVEKARAQMQRAGQIIQRVRQFVGHSRPQPVSLDAACVLSELLPLIRLQAIDAGVSVDLLLPAALAPVLADRVLIEQIILNLTRNAIEAVADLPPERQRVEIEAAAAPGEAGVLLAVRDRGPGLGPQARTILTASLNTTKPGGLGMGLAICRKAAEMLGSKLEYQDRLTGGAAFSFRLPLASAPAATQPAHVGAPGDMN